MSSCTIVPCRLCGKKMKRYNMRVYPGDSTCCSQCNEEADKEEARQEKKNRPFERQVEWFRNIHQDDRYTMGGKAPVMRFGQYW